MTDLTPIISLVLTTLFTIVTAFFIPWLKTNIDANKLNNLLIVVRAAVQAAEQIFRETGMGAKKKEYVVQYLAEHGYKLDTDELDVMIESAVKEMHMEVASNES